VRRLAGGREQPSPARRLEERAPVRVADHPPEQEEVDELADPEDAEGAEVDKP